MPSPSQLSELMDLDLLQDKTPEEIADIWIKVRSNPITCCIMLRSCATLHPVGLDTG
jgi:hypothetical protein